MNKALVVVLGAIVLISVAVGGLVGMQVAGDGGDGSTSGAETPTPTPAATPTPTSTSTATPTPTPTPTPEAADDPTPTPTPTPTPLSESIDAESVEAELVAGINGEVRSDRAALKRHDTLDEMARFHSDNMRDQGYPDHDAAGYSTMDRYEEYEEADRCRILSDNERSYRTGEEIEVIGRVPADRDTAEEEIADRLIAQWLEDSSATERLRYENADELGVGVTVDDRGYVYATVDLC